MKSKTGFVFNDKYADHVLQPGHPESPERLKAIKRHMEETGLIDKVVPVKPLDNREEVLLFISEIHSEDHIGTVIDTPTTGEIAILAAAGVLGAVRAVMEDQIQNAFCAVRPPGHHAHNNTAHYDGRAQGEGFCFFNNVAVAARYAQKVYRCKNILILDWDYHHGNGTEWTFYNDPTVFFFSTHALYTYPGTGLGDNYGEGDGLGYNLNVPFQGYANDSDIIDAWNNRLLPKLDELQFKPDLVLISAGFDSREDDLLGTFSFTDACFAQLTKIAMGIADTHCEGRLVSTLEGGYYPEGQAKAVCAHIGALLSPS